MGPARPVDEPDCPVCGDRIVRSAGNGLSDLGAGPTGLPCRSSYINRSPARLRESGFDF